MHKLIINRCSHHVVTLIKFLDAKDVEKVLSGNLKLGSVRKFRIDYKDECGLRHDTDEFVSASYVADQNTNIVIEIEGKSIGTASKIKNRLSYDDRSYIFSMSAITDNLLNQNTSWHFDSRVINLGNQAIIITDPCEFLHRVNSAIQLQTFLNSYTGSNGQASGLVEYIDFDKYNGTVGPFRKSNKYDFQKEWRLALVDSRDEVTHYPDCHFLEVGDLKDISLVADTDFLVQRGFTLETNDPFLTTFKPDLT